MGKHGQQENARTVVKIPKQGTEQHAGHEAKKLQVKGTEQNGGCPNGNVNIFGGAEQLRLQQATKNQFFSKGRQDSNYNKCQEKFSCRGKLGPELGKIFGTVFVRTCPIFKP